MIEELKLLVKTLTYNKLRDKLGTCKTKDRFKVEETETVHFLAISVEDPITNLTFYMKQVKGKKRGWAY